MNTIMQKYRIVGRKGEGTFSEVLECENLKDGSHWACKKMKQQYDSMDQVNNLREVQALRRLSPHANILELHEVLFDKKFGTLVLVCELMDMNIYELIKDMRHYLPEQRVKKYMYQLCRSVEHMHKNGIFHRDVKPENILIKDELLKLADFGSCRSVYSEQPYTEYISTRWYRAPECLLTDGYYGYKMDMWSIGCVFFEILSLYPLFPGSNEVDQISKIHDIIGTPNPGVLGKLRNKARGMNFNFPSKKGTGIERLLPHASAQAIDLIYQLCAYDPESRITAKQALRHAYFKDVRDIDKRPIALLNKGVNQKRQEHKITDVRSKPNDSQDSSTQGKLGRGNQENVAPSINLNDQVVKTEIHPMILAKAQSYPTQQHPLRDKKRKRFKRTSENMYNFGTGLTLGRGHLHGSTFSTAMYTNPSSTFHSSFYKQQPSTNPSYSMFPTIANIYKNRKLPAQSNKSLFSQYQLPSIDKRGTGY